MRLLKELIIASTCTRMYDNLADYHASSATLWCFRHPCCDVCAERSMHIAATAPATSEFARFSIDSKYSRRLHCPIKTPQKPALRNFFCLPKKPHRKIGNINSPQLWRCEKVLHRKQTTTDSYVPIRTQQRTRHPYSKTSNPHIMCYGSARQPSSRSVFACSEAVCHLSNEMAVSLRLLDTCRNVCGVSWYCRAKEGITQCNQVSR